jgi:hypothetical protein
MILSIDAPSWDIPSSCTIMSDRHVEDSRNVEGLPAARFPDPPDVKPHRPPHIKKGGPRRDRPVPQVFWMQDRGVQASSSAAARKTDLLALRGYAVQIAFDVAFVLPIFPPFEVGGHATDSEPTALGRRSCRGATIPPHAACARSQASQHGWSKKRQP